MGIAEPDAKPNGPKHAELARRIAIAVGSYESGVSYATQEKRMEGALIDPSWHVVADKLHEAVAVSVSEKLRKMFEPGA
jgi:hypothetical protein